MNEPTQDLELSGSRYQLTRFSAREGSWILSQFMPHLGVVVLAPGDTPMDDKSLGLILSQAMSDFPEDTFYRIQNKALTACRKYDGEVLKPLLMADGTGRWAIPEPDPLTTTALTTAVLAFNLLSFFGPEAHKVLMTVFPDLKTFSPKSPKE